MKQEIVLTAQGYLELEQELNALYNADPNEYYSKGYSKILQ